MAACNILQNKTRQDITYKTKGMKQVYFVIIKVKITFSRTL